MADRLPLTFAVSDLPHTAALRGGSVPIEGVDPQWLTIKPQIAAYRRMVRDVEFDVCELAATTYIVARAYGAPFKALPVFLVRKFHHSGLLIRPDRGIRHPRDLEGRRIGVRAYSVTTGVWTRQALADDFGMDLGKATWVVDDEEHVTQLRLPPNVVHAPEGRSLAAMMGDGDLDAGLAGAAGVGRTGDPTTNWQQVEANYPDLFQDSDALEADFYRRTGVYPMHGLIVVRESLLDAHPWLARALYDAFDEAKRQWLARLDGGEARTATDERYRALQSLVGPDPLPYGLAANLATLRALERTAYEQGLTPRRLALDELFVDPSLI